jgi:hypothetical protein
MVLITPEMLASKNAAHLYQARTLQHCVDIIHEYINITRLHQFTSTQAANRPPSPKQLIRGQIANNHYNRHRHQAMVQRKK